jgi:pyruvate/2-oxoacid:ferredoxin oxidoreductase alpha subunit
MAERQLMTGNEAMAEGAIRAGCRTYFGYPITPQNEILEYMAAHLPQRVERSSRQRARSRRSTCVTARRQPGCAR